MTAINHGRQALSLRQHANAYHPMVPASVRVPPGHHETLVYSVVPSHNWYDLTVAAQNFHRRFAGRMETGAHGFSDPAI
jgi:phospholipase C